MGDGVMNENNKDSYIVPRSGIPKNVDHAHLLEVEGCCPLCGKYLLKDKNDRKTKVYEIAHIYPSNPTISQVSELSGLERLGDTSEDSRNKIALCKDCHGKYDDHTRKEEYLILVEVKKRLIILSNARVSTSYQNIEDEIIKVINAINDIDESTIQELKLKYNGIKLRDKFESKYTILKNKIEFYVCNYYYFIKETDSQNLLKKAKVLELSIGGKELFGKSWNDR